MSTNEYFSCPPLGFPLSAYGENLMSAHTSSTAGATKKTKSIVSIVSTLLEIVTTPRVEESGRNVELWCSNVGTPRQLVELVAEVVSQRHSS